MKWPHLYRFVILGLYTGSRAGVLLALQWSWFDLERGTMRRRAPREVEDPRKRTPPVRLGRALVRLLRRWKRQDDASGQKRVIAYQDRAVRRFTKSWPLACKIAGLTGVTPHVLRHTRATWLMQAGVDVWEAGGHLGMSPATLIRVYGHHSPDFQKRAAEV